MTTEQTLVEKTFQKLDIKDKQISVVNGLKLQIDIADVLQDAAKAYINSEESGMLWFIEERIKEEASKLRPIEVTVGDRPAVKFEGRVHKNFAVLLQALQHERQAFLVGPAGTGKTTLAGQAAKAMGLEFGHISCTAGMSEAHLMGRMIADGSYIPSEFVTLYENGGVFLFDEVDAADPNTLLIINSALANGRMSVPNRRDNSAAIRHKDFYAICVGNTYGNGSNQYSGRSILDAAFMDRFCMSKIDITYDTDLERELLAERLGLADKLWRIRGNIDNYKLRRILSTRVFVASLTKVRDRIADKDILDRFFTGWSKEEVSKALTGITP
jgi:cobaltochelatase CobS